LQRPKIAPGLIMTPAEAAKLHVDLQAQGNHGDGVGQSTSEFPEMGESYARVWGQIRSSWLVDPSDGRLPYTEAAKRAVQAYGDAQGSDQGAIANINDAGPSRRGTGRRRSRRFRSGC
jgi:hypothetical protein